MNIIGFKHYDQGVQPPHMHSLYYPWANWYFRYYLLVLRNGDGPKGLHYVWLWIYVIGIYIQKQYWHL